MKNNFKMEFNEFNSRFWNNFLLIARSILKNFRTYVYLFFVPALALGIYTWYSISGGNGDSIRTPQLFMFMMIPTYSIIFLVNITVAEWKNSVFLKRIHSAGSSKIEFLLCIWFFNLLLGLLSFLFGFLMLLILSQLYFKLGTETGSFLTQLSLINFGGWISMLYSATLNIFMLIVIGTIISGSIKSVALSQSITILYVLLAIVFSDNFLPLELMAVKKGLVNFTYIFPQKHALWVGLIGAANGNVTWLYQNPGRIFLSFGFHQWIPYLSGTLYLIGLITISYFSFNWNNKR